MGAKCCSSGQATCKAIDEYYSQCVASSASGANVIGMDAQVADLSSSVMPAMPHWPSTLLPLAGGVFLASLMVVVLGVRRHLRGKQRYPYRLMLSSEDGSPVLPSPLDTIEAEIA